MTGRYFRVSLTASKKWNASTNFLRHWTPFSAFCVSFLSQPRSQVGSLFALPPSHYHPTTPPPPELISAAHLSEEENGRSFVDFWHISCHVRRPLRHLRVAHARVLLGGHVPRRRRRCDCLHYIQLLQLIVPSGIRLFCNRQTMQTIAFPRMKRTKNSTQGLNIPTARQGSCALCEHYRQPRQ